MVHGAREGAPGPELGGVWVVNGARKAPHSKVSRGQGRVVRVHPFKYLNVRHVLTPLPLYRRAHVLARPNNGATMATTTFIITTHVDFLKSAVALRRGWPRGRGGGLRGLRKRTLRCRRNWRKPCSTSGLALRFLSFLSCVCRGCRCFFTSWRWGRRRAHAPGRPSNRGAAPAADECWCRSKCSLLRRLVIKVFIIFFISNGRALCGWGCAFGAK